MAPESVDDRRTLGHGLWHEGTGQRRTRPNQCFPITLWCQMGVALTDTDGCQSAERWIK